MTLYNQSESHNIDIILIFSQGSTVLRLSLRWCFGLRVALIQYDMPPKGKAKNKKRAVEALTPIQVVEKKRRIEVSKESFATRNGGSIRVMLFHSTMMKTTAKDLASFKARIEVQLVEDHGAEAPEITGIWDNGKERGLAVRVHSLDERWKLQTSAGKLGWASFCRSDTDEPAKFFFDITLRKLRNPVDIDNKESTIKTITEIIKKRGIKLEKENLDLARPPIAGSGVHFILITTCHQPTLSALRSVISVGGKACSFAGQIKISEVRKVVNRDMAEIVQSTNTLGIGNQPENDGTPRTSKSSSSTQTKHRSSSRSRRANVRSSSAEIRSKQEMID